MANRLVTKDLSDNIIASSVMALSSIKNMSTKIVSYKDANNVTVGYTGCLIPVKMGDYWGIIDTATDVHRVNDLDTGSIAPSTAYYVYVVTNGSTVSFKTSTNSSAPSGYSTSTSEKLGGFTTNSSSEVDSATVWDVKTNLGLGATTDKILVGGGANMPPVATTATGTGAPVRATSPTLTTPIVNTSITVPVIKPASDSTTAIQIADKDGNAILNVDTTNDRVGIGTTNPNTKLHIYSSSQGDLLNLDYAGSGLKFNPYNSAYSNAATIRAETAGGLNFVTTNGNRAIRFFDRTVEIMRVTPNYGLALGYTADPGAGSMIISGNVGIGTTGPEQKLSVKDGYIQVEKSVNVSNTEVGQLVFRNLNSNLGTQGGDIPAAIIVSTGSYANRGILQFATSNNDIGATVKVTIDNLGNVGIGITTPTHLLQMGTDDAYKATEHWSVPSDMRLKEDIQPANLDILYNVVKNLPLKYYKWKDEYVSELQCSDRHMIGWLSDDVETVFPKAINISAHSVRKEVEEEVEVEVKDEEGNPILDEEGNPIKETKLQTVTKDITVLEDCKNINTTLIDRALYGAVQKLIQKVEALESRIAALEA